MAYVWQTWLATALRAEGCTVREYTGWTSRGRPSSTGGYAPYAVGMHHTGTRTSSSNPHPTLSAIVNGRADLPGPLAAGLIGYDGVVDLVAAGRCNHGGQARSTGPMPSGDANYLYVGFEIDYDGTQPMSSAQHQAAVRAAAAVLRHFGKPSSYARQHNEWSTTGKWDCGGWDNDGMRAEIAAQLGSGGDDVTSPTDVVGADSDGSNLTMGELSARMNWLYQQWLSLGSLKAQLNRIEEALRK